MDHTAKLALLEAVKPIAPASDHVHDLLNQSIEKIAQDMVGELEALRKNATDLETRLLAAAAGAKASINKLRELHTQIADEARRGQEVCRKVSDSVEQIAG
jgi:uncharacterized protein involved in exopolysaccharide biosynthesis